LLLLALPAAINSPSGRESRMLCDSNFVNDERSMGATGSGPIYWIYQVKKQHMLTADGEIRVSSLPKVLERPKMTGVLST
jgi:hypothetical protein